MKNQIIDPKGNIFKWKEIDHPKFKYVVTKNYIVKISINGPNIEDRFYSLIGDQLFIKVGYRWDGASGPTIDTHNTMRASCIHDVLYQMIRSNQLSLNKKDIADKELQKVMIEDWKPKTAFGEVWNLIRSGYFYWAVRLFGKSSCIPEV